MRKLAVCVGTLLVLLLQQPGFARAGSLSSLFMDSYFSSSTAAARALLYLPPPPTAASPAQYLNVLINSVILAQASPQAVAQAQRLGNDPTIFAFAGILGAGFTPQNLPTTIRFFDKLTLNTQDVNNILKGYYNSPGPQMPGTYPSNHALLGAINGLLLGLMVPEKQGQLQTFGIQFGLERLVVNAHWATDVFIAQREALLLVNNLFANPQFLSDFNAAKAEVRAALYNGAPESPQDAFLASYNTFLQSVVAQSEMKSVEAKVGGQVHADAASYVLRAPQRIDEAVTTYTDSRLAPEGQTQFWLAGFGGGFWTKGRIQGADSTEYTAGTVAGATHRFSERFGMHAGVGYNWGQVQSADAQGTMNTPLATLGARYGFTSLDSGLFVEGRANGGWMDYQSKRVLNGAMGTATGSSNGFMYSGRLGLGDVVRLSPVTLTPQVGARVSGVSLWGFTERDSDVALGVHPMNKTLFSLFGDLDVAAAPLRLGSWSFVPSVNLGYERFLDTPQVTSTAVFSGYGVSTQSAYDARNLWKAGVGITAEREAFKISARGNGVLGDAAASTGVGGQLFMSYNF